VILSKYTDDPYYISPEEEKRLERRAKIDQLEDELEAARQVIFGDNHGDAAYWIAVERARQIEAQLKAIEEERS
jgi:hypothetical protein